MLIFRRFLLSKLESSSCVKLNFSESILSDLLSNSIGKPTSKDELKYYKLRAKTNKFTPLVFNKLKPRVKLLATAANHDQLPQTNRPEICVYGSFNVGKSSFINKFLNKSMLCKVDSSLRTTTKLHFYNVGKHPNNVCVVDMPGYYGYQTAPADHHSHESDPDDTEKAVNPDKDPFEPEKRNKEAEREARIREVNARLEEFCLSYIKYRPNLILVVILVDVHRGITESDLRVMNFCDCNRVKFLALLNKSDLVKPVELTKRIQVARNRLKIFKFQLGHALPVSCTKLQNFSGIHELVTGHYLACNESFTAGPGPEPEPPRPGRHTIPSANRTPLEAGAGDFKTLAAARQQVPSITGPTETSLAPIPGEPSVTLFKLNVPNAALLATGVDQADALAQLGATGGTPGGPAAQRSLIEEKAALFDRRVRQHLATKYQVSKLRLNRSYKKMFSHFKATIMKNNVIRLASR